MDEVADKGDEQEVSRVSRRRFKGEDLHYIIVRQEQERIYPN
jgi:hypothetical protein